MHDMCTVSLPPRPDIRSISRLPCLCDARDRSPGPQVYRGYRRKPAHNDGHIYVLTWVGVVVPPHVFGVWGHCGFVCPAASYSPTHLRVQYHQRWEA